MPTYEYACAACGHEWEEIQRITAPPIDLCPKCAKSSAHRLISGGTNFILKGGGWYSDLYASPSASGKKAEANGASSTDGGGKTDTKTEAKPAAAATASTAATPATPATPSSSSAPSGS
jgi:putative FmdB family regulatory protein